MKKIAFVYTTFPDEESAKKCIKLLLEEKCIACANVTQSKSQYLWNGAITDAIEFITMAKTSTTKLQDAIHHIKKYHPYQIPCILSWEADSEEEYALWVEEQTI